MMDERKLAPPRPEQEKPVNNLWPSKAELTRAILKMLADGDGAYFTTEIAARLRAPYASVRLALTQLERANQVHKKSAGTSNNQSIWWLDHAQRKLDRIREISDVGLLFDGADHLNEYTHEENEKHVIAALDRINEICKPDFDMEDL